MKARLPQVLEHGKVVNVEANAHTGQGISLVVRLENPSDKREFFLYAILIPEEDRFRVYDVEEWNESDRRHGDYKFDTETEEWVPRQ